MPTNVELLDLAVGLRADTFDYELVNEDRSLLGTLSVVEDASPNVQLDTTRTAMRLANNVEIVVSDLTQIDIFHERVRIWMRLQNGARYALGVFMFGEQNRMPHTWGNRYTPQLFDESFLLNQRLGRSYSVAKGGSVLGMFKLLLTELQADGHLPTVNLNVPDVLASSPMTYQVGTLRYDALKALAQALGCFPPYFNNAGVFTLKLVPPSGATTVNHVYDVNTHIIDDSTTLVSDAFTAPNRWIAISDSPAGAVVGIYNLPSTAPSSAAVTGRVVTADIVNAQGLNASQANAVARNAALADRSVFDKATFSSTVDPRHGVFDTVRLLGVRYLETGWSIDCVSGGDMTHSLSRIYD